MKTFKTIQEAWEDVIRHIKAEGGDEVQLSPSHKAAFFSGAAATVKILRDKEGRRTLSEHEFAIIHEAYQFAQTPEEEHEVE